MEKLSYGGIDVSKDRLDVVVLPEGWFFSVSNDTAGWAELVARLRPLAVCAIGLEPSGGYERGIIRALLAAGLSVRRINPNKLRQFARARGVLAKNDRLDAGLIAEYAPSCRHELCNGTTRSKGSPRSSPCGDSCVTSMSPSRTRLAISKM
jgi:transposase